MSIRVACSWCSTRNDVTKARMNNLAIYCRHCGHHADLSQRRCDCHQCFNSAEAMSKTEPQQGKLFVQECEVSDSPES